MDKEEKFENFIVKLFDPAISPRYLEANSKSLQVHTSFFNYAVQTLPPIMKFHTLYLACSTPFFKVFMTCEFQHVPLITVTQPSKLFLSKIKLFCYIDFGLNNRFCCYKLTYYLRYLLDFWNLLLPKKFNIRLN
ncbi:hypothetical protein BpHYR1_046209 [Brachionus plicatilis]|uniref:Uncharacterized protein n=1 Tax=Brachionus plicatilis TaxID=10195 RepID=A0A3M7SMX8_BRAPC|nr:hypothetical protein BpHYR1_046209 [Brachionus plicatilis]